MLINFCDRPNAPFARELIVAIQCGANVMTIFWSGRVENEGKAFTLALREAFKKENIIVVQATLKNRPEYNNYRNSSQHLQPLPSTDLAFQNVAVIDQKIMWIFAAAVRKYQDKTQYLARNELQKKAYVQTYSALQRITSYMWDSDKTKEIFTNARLLKPKNLDALVRLFDQDVASLEARRAINIHESRLVFGSVHALFHSLSMPDRYKLGSCDTVKELAVASAADNKAQPSINGYSLLLYFILGLLALPVVRNRYRKRQSSEELVASTAAAKLR